MELFDLYDRDRIPTGETIERGQKLPPGRYHLVVHICVFNRAGQMLIQLRSKNKLLWPGLWDVSVGGAAQKGDLSWQAAHRELAEELGIVTDLSQVRPAFTFNFERGFDDIYLIELDLELDKLRLQPEEVTQVGWADAECIHALIEKGDFLPYHHSLIDLFFDLRFTPRFFAEKRS